MNRVVGRYLFASRSIVLSGVMTIASGVTVLAASTPTLTQSITAGTLTTDILDDTHTPVIAPATGMTQKSFSSECRTGIDASTGAMGSNTQRVYVTNPSGADGGWTLSIAATSGPTALWTSGSNTYDFNDPTGGGCTDGADADSRAGQLTIDPSIATVNLDCVECTQTGITKGSLASFSQGTLDSVTLLSAGPSADKVWQGYLTGVGLSQTIPAQTPAGNYSLNLTLTAVAL